MLQVAWKERYRVNHPLIDEQHQKLVSILNELILIATQRDTANDVSTLFRELISYARNHFTVEEKLLESVNYPFLLNHQQAHRAYITRLLNLNSRYDADDEAMLVEMISFLKEWLVDHITDMDHEFAPYIKNDGSL